MLFQLVLRRLLAVRLSLRFAVRDVLWPRVERLQLVRHDCLLRAVVGRFGLRLCGLRVCLLRQRLFELRERLVRHG